MVNNIMQYYHFNFINNVVLILIQLIITGIAMRNTRYLGISLLISLLCLMGLIGQVLFIAVLMDNQAVVQPWRSGLNVLFSISGVLILIQLFIGVPRACEIDKKNE